jgi:hypothetical protein
MKKTLALAALTALSLGIGSAMAQSNGPSAPMSNDSQRTLVIQAGSADIPVTSTRGMPAYDYHVTIPAYDYGTLNTPM